MTKKLYFYLAETLVKATLNGKTVKRKNETYLLFDTISINVNFKDFSVMIENLFKKDQNLSKLIDIHYYCLYYSLSGMNLAV